MSASRSLSHTLSSLSLSLLALNLTLVRTLPLSRSRKEERNLLDCLPRLLVLYTARFHDNQPLNTGGVLNRDHCEGTTFDLKRPTSIFTLKSKRLATGIPSSQAQVSMTPPGTLRRSSIPARQSIPARSSILGRCETTTQFFQIKFQRSKVVTSSRQKTSVWRKELVEV